MMLWQWHTQDWQPNAQVKQVGEALLTVGGANGWGPEVLSSQQLDAVLQAVQGRLKSMEAEMTLLRRRTLPASSKEDAGMPSPCRPARCSFRAEFTVAS